jgi:hypothetical protein
MNEQEEQALEPEIAEEPVNNKFHFIERKVKNPIPPQLVGKQQSWKPGQSGNPNGRPKKWSDIIEAELNKESLSRAKSGPGFKTIKEIITIKLLDMARHGNVRAIHELLDRNLGKPKESIELSGGLDVGISRLSDEELDRRLEELEGRKINTPIGTPETPV